MQQFVANLSQVALNICKFHWIVWGQREYCETFESSSFYYGFAILQFYNEKSEKERERARKRDRENGSSALRNYRK